MKSSEYLELGREYTRGELKKSFDIADETIKTGIFKPRGHNALWLFITQESGQPDYNDLISEDKLFFSGQPSGRTDKIIVEHKASGLELLVFYREEPRGPFTYCGRAEYIGHTKKADKPTHFRARLLDIKRDDASGQFVISTSQDVVKEKVRFVADTHLIQVLGEQLIASEKVGILELIKNAYDANASYCKVWIENVPNIQRSLDQANLELEWSDSEVAKLQGPVITIQDNGRGMDYRTLIDGWLRPATTLKTSVKQRLKEERKKADERGTRASYESMLDALKTANGGRLPLGEKGVGRFATHRLGRYLILHTKTADDPREWKLTIDWTKFDAAGPVVDLSSVTLDLVHQPPEINYDRNGSGTRLRIYGGRDGYEWTSDTLHEIGEAIAHLRSPVRTPLSFEPEFICPQLGETIEVPTKTVPAPFHCTALVEANGIATIEITFDPPPSLDIPLSSEKWSDTIDLRTENDYWLTKDKQQKRKSSLRLPQCGPFLLDTKCWLRRNAWIQAPDTTEFTKYLDKFGGIGIFRNGLAIFPAQDAAKRDWLGLEKKIIKRGINISYYNLSGSVEITQEDNADLTDQTSREGMLDTTPYQDLSALVRSIVDLLTLRVIETREKEERLRRGTSIPKATLNKQMRMTEQVLDVLSKNYDFEQDTSGILAALKVDVDTASETPTTIMRSLKYASNELRHEVDRLEEQVNALLEVAGFAISIGVALHEIEKITDNLYHGINRIVKVSATGTEIHDRALALSQVAQSLLNELRRIAPLRVTRLERKQKFNVRDAILAASGAFQVTWSDEEIEFIAPLKSEDFKILGSFGASSQVFANLFDNATYWVRQQEEQQRKIGVFADAASRRVIVADSGSGISPTIREHLFEPFYSLKTPASGLGLYICQYYMRQMKGSIREAKESERVADFAGAQFVVIFPKNEDEE